MLPAVLVILIVLWLLGIVNINGLAIPNPTLFSINGHPITLINLLIFIVIASLLELLPSPLNIIAGIILLLWVLSILGIIAIAGLSHILVLAIIVGLVLFVLGLL